MTWRAHAGAAGRKVWRGLEPDRPVEIAGRGEHGLGLRGGAVGEIVEAERKTVIEHGGRLSVTR